MSIPINIETERLILRSVTADDVGEQDLGWLNDTIATGFLAEPRRSKQDTLGEDEFLADDSVLFHAPINKPGSRREHRRRPNRPLMQPERRGGHDQRPKHRASDVREEMIPEPPMFTFQSRHATRPHPCAPSIEQAPTHWFEGATLSTLCSGLGNRTPRQQRPVTTRPSGFRSPSP